MSVFQQEGNRLKYHYDAEELWLEPWGANSLRVRATKEAEMPKESWALLEAPECGAEIEITEDGARIKNGKIRAEVSKYGKITFYNQRVSSYWRNTPGQERICLPKHAAPWKWSPGSSSRF